MAHDADYLPGLVIDQYGDWISFQILSAGMELLRETIVEIIKEKLNPIGLVERSDEAVRKKEGLKPRKEVIFGELPKNGIEVIENGMKLIVDIWEGHKTGFYIDQRDNRDAIRSYAKGKRVLNCFSYTGGFSIAAGLGGAIEVVSVDESQPALDIAKRNWELNGIKSKSSFVRADVFKYLRELKDQGEVFDFIVLDPPKFASSQRNVQGACRGYKDLNLLAWQIAEAGRIARQLFLFGLDL